MPSYETQVDVAAPPGRVWAVTCDVESWPSWSPTMTAVTRQDTGPIQVGSSARVRQPKLRPATWVVTDLREDREFGWATSGPGYRIHAGHAIEPVGQSSRVRLTATVTGPLAGPIWLLAGRTVRRYLDQEATALKAHCERTG
jgi:uncharacterized membrane protein